MTRRRSVLGGERVVELEFDLLRLVFFFAAFAALVAGAFFAGRWSTGGQAVAAAPARATHSEASEGSFAPGSGSLFDEAGGATPRELGRQITEEISLGGGFEIDLGTVRSRAQAERIRALAEKEGVRALIVGAGRGVYRVAGGPFTRRAEAEQAARTLAKVLGRNVPVSGDGH